MEFPPAPKPGKYHDLDTGLPVSPWLIALVAVLVLAGGLFAIPRRDS